MRVLLFGGSFDPPHRAHVELAACAAAVAGCDRIVYIPSAHSPLRLAPPDTSPEHRVAMLRLATRDQPNAEISTIELDRGGVSYFIDTLEAIRAEADDATELCFLVGSDQALHFPRWKDWRHILEIADPVVLIRPPWTRESLVKALIDVYGERDAQRWIDAIAETPLFAISSTVLRNDLENGEPRHEGLDPAVAAYIADHGLYGVQVT